MKTGIKEQSAKVIGYKIVLSLVIGVSALSGAKNDLKRLQGLSDSMSGLSLRLMTAGVTTVNAKSASADDAVCKNVSGEELTRNITTRSRDVEIEGDIVVNLPSTRSSEFKIVRHKRTASSDFQRRVARVVRQRRINDAFETDLHQLVFKTFNGNVSFRPVS
jgi:hypothetical protein